MSILDKYLSPSADDSSNDEPIQQSSIIDKYLSPTKNSDPLTTDVVDNSLAGMQEKNRASFTRGLRDILDTGAHGLGNAASFVAEKTLPQEYSLPIKTSVENMISSDTAARKTYEQKYNPEGSIDPMRIAGQVVGSLPLVPAKAIQFWKSAVGALPTVSAGVKTAAPFINRIAGAIGEGGIGGAVYGAATASSNDKSTVENIGEGALGGAIAGPVLHAAGEAGANIVPAIKSLWAKSALNKYAQNSGLEPSVAKNILARLQDAGITPTEAQTELTKLGPKATLVDLANSLLTEANGLARYGGKPTSILRNKMEARAELANNDIVKTMDQHLGSKPDIEAEKEAIIANAQKSTGPDYKAAHSSGQNLDISKVIDNIDNQLKTAVGGKAKGLNLIKGYLQREDGSVKNTIPELHEVRQAIDDAIEGKQPETSYGRNALRSITDVRKGVDAALKTNPQMAAADLKFSQEMDIAKGLQIGYDTLTKKTTKEEFGKIWQNADPKMKETIKKGMRAAIGDFMESAQKGELSGALQKLGSKSVNRANLRLAYGVNADNALDALQKEATFRASENSIRHGSVTSEALAVQKRYGEQAGGNALSDFVHGAIADATTGAHFLGTGITLAKRGGAKVLQNLTGNRLERLTTGTADILAQDSHHIQHTLNVLDQINKIQSKIIPKAENKFKLPATLSAPIAEISYSEHKQSN